MDQITVEEPKERKIISIDEGQLREHLDKMVLTSVDETLNGLLDAEADRLCGASRYEHSPDRVDTRAGHYERKLHTTAGEVKLRVPKLRTVPFETQIIEALSSSAIERGGSSYRDVSGRRECAPGRRYNGGLVGHPGERLGDQRSEQEDLRAYRALAQASVGRAVSLRVSGRIVVEAQLGRRGA